MTFNDLSGWYRSVFTEEERRHLPFSTAVSHAYEAFELHLLETVPAYRDHFGPGEKFLTAAFTPGRPADRILSYFGYDNPRRHQELLAFLRIDPKPFEWSAL